MKVLDNNDDWDEFGTFKDFFKDNELKIETLIKTIRTILTID
jgi:hypothetical protein